MAAALRGPLGAWHLTAGDCGGRSEDAAGVVDVEVLDHPPVDGDHAATLGGRRLERLDHWLGQRFVERGIDRHRSRLRVARFRRVERHLRKRRRGEEQRRTGEVVRPAPAAKRRAGKDGAGAGRVVLENCGRIDPERLEEYIACDGYQALARALGTVP